MNGVSQRKNNYTHVASIAKEAAFTMNVME